MFGQNKQDDDTVGQAVPVTVATTPVDDSNMITAAAEDELNLPAPAVDDTSMSPDMSAPEYVETPAAPTSSLREPTPDVEFSSPPITISNSGNMQNLSALKQEALHELSPLIGQLDLSPDEKYATAKMVYEETNDQALLSAVYDAAKELPEDKAKAEAIYDVIKKINEFNSQS